MAPQDQAFVAAAAAGNLHLMNRYLFPDDAKRRSAKNDFLDERGCSALALATRNGRLDAVQWLVKVISMAESHRLCSSRIIELDVRAILGGLQC